MTKNASTIKCLKALTLMEMVIAMAIITVVFAVILPQFRLIDSSWDARQASADAVQNGRVFVDYLNRNLAKAAKITAVSAADDTNGYIEFQDTAGVTIRCDIGADNYIEYGPVGSQSELAGPVSSLTFTCYSLSDLSSPTTEVADIRLVKAEADFVNTVAQGVDKSFIASAFLVTETVTTTSEPGIYWADEEAEKVGRDKVGKILRAGFDGSNIEDLISATKMKPRSIALDIVGGKMYWGDEEDDCISRSNLDGSDIEELISVSKMKPKALALDLVNNKLYWADEEVDKIQRSNLDGSNVEDLVVASTMKPRAMALDIVNGKIYWADEEAAKVGKDKIGMIRRADLDGSNIEDLVVATKMKPKALALDISTGKMYWADEEIDKIQRSNLDGSNVEDLVVVATMKPRALALDVDGGKMYWADEETDKIHRSNLDGSAIEDLVSDVKKPRALALDLTE